MTTVPGLTRKGFPGSNTPAYLACSSVTKTKIFITLTTEHLHVQKVEAHIEGATPKEGEASRSSLKRDADKRHVRKRGT